jgi:cyclopropane-fatty-acyl-phospholipid synthase
LTSSGKLSDFGSGIKAEERMKEEMETFKRKWEYYFTYCEAGFATRSLGDVILTVAREGAEELMNDVPL